MKRFLITLILILTVAGLYMASPATHHASKDGRFYAGEISDIDAQKKAKG